MSQGIELKINKRVDFESTQFGVINTITPVKIPAGCVGVVAIRQRYGDRGLINTSQILWEGFDGCPVISAANLGGSLIELIEGEAIAHVAILRKADIEVSHNGGIHDHLHTGHEGQADQA